MGFRVDLLSLGRETFNTDVYPSRASFNLNCFGSIRLGWVSAFNLATLRLSKSISTVLCYSSATSGDFDSSFFTSSSVLTYFFLRLSASYNSYSSIYFALSCICLLLSIAFYIALSKFLFFLTWSRSSSNYSAFLLILSLSSGSSTAVSSRKFISSFTDLFLSTFLGFIDFLSMASYSLATLLCLVIRD